MANQEKEIATRIIASSGLRLAEFGLRFDKVVTRLLSNLRSFVEEEIPKGCTVLMTLTAPIKVPYQTEQEIKKRIKDLSQSKIRNQHISVTVFDNTVELMTLDHSPKNYPKFVGFVHNRGTNTKQLLDLCRQWLRDK